MRFLSNAFSLNMVDTKEPINIQVRPIDKSEITDFVSVVGHPDTANVLSGFLGCEVEFNRTTLSLEKDDILFVAQYKGPRLPEGATELPESATFEFLEVTLH